MPEPSARSRILTVAHRGNSWAAPENTLVAYREAAQEGADIAECDVYLSRDGVVYLMHDADVKRTTDGEGPGTALAMAELHALDAGSWKDARYAGEPVPMLTELLEQQADDPTQLVIEIKQAGIASPVVECIRAAGAVEHCSVISFSRDECRAVRVLEPRLPCLWLAGVPSGPAERTQLLSDLLADGLQGIDAHAPTVDQGFVRAAHRRGLAVWCWTVDDPAQWEALATMGVDAITTNRPGALRKWCAEAL
jgi:glycerophosphoryl diester phosphodiesterase